MRRTVLVVVVLGVLVAAGVIATRTSRTGTPAALGAPSNSAVGEVVAPVVTVAVDDVEAARAAAVAAVGLTGSIIDAGLISRRDLVASIATPAYGPFLVDDTSMSVESMLAELGARHIDQRDLRVGEYPLTAAATVEGAGVRVRVWSVMVIAAPGTGPARQVWRTVTVLMVDVEGRWLVDEWVSVFGPTPAPAVEVAFDDPGAVGAPMSWPPATATGADVVKVG